MTFASRERPRTRKLRCCHADFRISAISIHSQGQLAEALTAASRCHKILLADRTNGRTIGTVLRLSVVCRLYGMHCGWLVVTIESL